MDMQADCNKRFLKTGTDFESAGRNRKSEPWEFPVAFFRPDGKKLPERKTGTRRKRRHLIKESGIRRKKPS
jgi:hypothetical protein